MEYYVKEKKEGIVSLILKKKYYKKTIKGVYIHVV